MTTYIDKPISLLERKKKQWAQERDEQEHSWIPWQKNSQNNILQIGDEHITIVNHSTRRGDSLSLNSQRKNSLPPLTKTSYNSYEKGGETSGYASDNPNNISECSQGPTWIQNQSGYESSSSRDDRPKWRDKETASDLFWDGKKNCQKNGNEPPNWLKRGLEQDGHIEVTNSSPSESPEQDDTEQERPFTSSSSIRSRTTYIRGQNIHLDTAEIAERERKREIAKQHQEAVRKQLEEKERKRSEERKRRIQEEYEEEIRIAREQEIERRRFEEEQKLLFEKHEREERRKEAIREAIEIAEKEARLQKKKLKMIKQNNNSYANVKSNSNENTVQNNNEDNLKSNNEKNNIATMSTKSEKNKMNNNQQNDDKENNFNPELKKTETQNNKIMIKNNLDVPPASCSKEVQSNMSDMQNNVLKNLVNQKNETVTIVVPSNFDTLQHFQYAVLMPIPSSSSVPVAVPLSIVPNGNQSSISTTTRTENRILTPTQYRQKNKLMCDSSTQTDDCKSEKYSKEKNSNLDYENRHKKGRSSSRNENVGDRPKWGVNRPPTRYMKQSEKDPVYQRKKLRQRAQENIYDDKNSSDDSQFGTPRYRKKGYPEKRHSRPLWRKHEHQEVFAKNIRMYHSEIIPIETDRDNVYYEHRCCCTCKCTEKYQRTPKVDILEIDHQLPTKEEERLPTSISKNTSEDASLIVETLSSIRNDILKQEQWNSPRTPSLTSNGNTF
ncbi:hypothetical protein HHI36_019668 [Cryptolaemus montrouzieri]|uniref:CCDC66 domain-containing protein n=1 Tax=Cryptolaemus montrouzieri TaxID=559131 RepID=A0ABD2N9I9_9CUCU